MSTAARIVRLVVPAVLALVVASGSGVPANAAAEPAPRLAFAYDTTRPLGFADRGVVARHGGVTVHDVVFRSLGRNVPGYLVEGRGGGRRPGVVVVHGSGGDRRELLGDAVTLAQRGAVALTITEPSTLYPPPAPTTAEQLLAETTSTTVRDVVAVRRAADVLASLGSVDPRRIGYLGWSAGAKTGAFVAASDRRFGALALLSAGADKLSAFVAAAPKGIRARARRALGSVDPLRYVAWARPGTMLLEDGTRDSIVPHQALENMIAAAPHGTVVRWYPADHGLTERAHRDAVGWLLSTLG